MGYELPCSRATVDSSELISWRIPTYRISDLEMREILAPMNSVMMMEMREREDGDGGGQSLFRLMQAEITNPTLNMVTNLSPSLKLTFDIE
jgi:hypothetical protein